MSITHSIILIKQVLIPSASISLSSSTTFPKAKQRRKLNFPAFCSLEPLSTTSPSSTASTAMATTSADDEIAYDYSPFLKIYKNGRIERLFGTDVVPPSLDPDTGVECKDVVISSETGVSARLYLPRIPSGNRRRLPLVVYFHGGGFCVDTPFCAKYHHAVKTLVAESGVVAVSVHYRLAPENPIPIPYDDSWAAVEWVASHSDGTGPDEWLNTHADFRRVFFAGDSAGANIAHNVAVRAGVLGRPAGLNLAGMVLVHPYFWGSEPVGNEPKEPEKRTMAEGIWRFAYPTTPNGSDDPWMNPAKDPNVGKVVGKRVLVFVAEKDGLRERGWYYKEVLERSGWGGTVEVVEAKGDDHVHHLNNPTCDNAVALVKKIASFVNQD